MNVLHDATSNTLANPVDRILTAECQLDEVMDGYHLFVLGPIPSQLEDKTSRIQPQIALEDSAMKE